MVRDRIHVDVEKLVPFCRQHHIRKLSLFGSVLRDDFRPDSDVDVMVEFEPDGVPGLIGFAGIELELEQLVGRKVDLNTPRCFSEPLRDRVMAEAEVLYAAS
jgi:predicted nucleotidyltransferase